MRDDRGLGLYPVSTTFQQSPQNRKGGRWSRGLELRRLRLSTSGRRSVSDRSLRQGQPGDTVEGNCPGCEKAPIVACRKADGLVPYCGSSWTVLWVASNAVVEAGRA